MFKIIAGCFRERKRSFQYQKQIRQVSSFFQALQGPILTATRMILSTFPSTLLQITLTLKYLPSGQVKNDPQKEELLVFHLSHQDK